MAKHIRRIVIDSCIILDFLTRRNPTDFQRAEALFIDHGKEYDIIVPAIVLTEILCHPDTRNLNLSDDELNFGRRLNYSVRMFKQFMPTSLINWRILKFQSSIKPYVISYFSKI